MKTIDYFNRTQFLSLTTSRVYAWLCWFLASCFLFYKYVLYVSPSIMTNDLMMSFHLSAESLGTLAGCYFYAYMSMQLPAGLLLDRFNPRNTICVAILVCTLGAWLFGHATHLWLAQAGRLLIGFGGAFSALGTLKIISIYFPPQQFALVSGLMMSMAMLGAIGGEAPLAALVEHTNWRTASLYCALVGASLAVLFFLLVKLPDKNKEATTSLSHVFSGLKQIVKNPQSWLISIYSGLAFMPISAFAGLWGIPFIMQKYELTKTLTASAVSLTFIGFAVGAPFAGWLSEKIKRRKPLMVGGTCIMLALMLAIVYLPTFPYFILCMAFTSFGFFAAFFFVSFTVMKEINDNAFSGTSMAFINSCNALCGAFADPLIGRLLDLHWHGAMLHGVRYFTTQSYEQSLIALPIGLVIALCLQCFIKETYCQSTLIKEKNHG